MKITMKRNKKDYSENKINVYQICLVALAVGINIVGGQIALFMKLPVYLDSIGYLFVIFCTCGYDHRYHEWTCFS